MRRIIGVWGLLAATCLGCGDEASPAGGPPAATGSEGGAPSVPDVPAPPEPKSATTSPLPRSTPEAEGVSSQGVLDLVTALEAQMTELHSLMLVRHGKVVAEGW